MESLNAARSRQDHEYALTDHPHPAPALVRAAEAERQIASIDRELRAPAYHRGRDPEAADRHLRWQREMAEEDLAAAMRIVERGLPEGVIL